MNESTIDSRLAAQESREGDPDVVLEHGLERPLARSSEIDHPTSEVVHFTDGTVLVDSSFADGRDLHPGDPVTFTFAQGPVTYDVAAVLEPVPLLAMPAMTIDSLADAGFPQEDATIFVTGPDAGLDALKEAVGTNPLLTVNARAAEIHVTKRRAAAPVCYRIGPITAPTINAP